MKKLMKSIVLTSSLILALGATQHAVASSGSADMAKGLNVMVTSPDSQTQLMAMVLSLQTIKKHEKKVNMVLCGPAGKLALKETVTPKLKPRDVSPTMLLNKIIKLGGNVSVCPLYLPNAGKTKADLIQGIEVAKPPVIAGKLLNKNFQNLAY